MYGYEIWNVVVCGDLAMTAWAHDLVSAAALPTYDIFSLSIAFSVCRFFFSFLTRNILKRYFTQKE